MVFKTGARDATSSERAIVGSAAGARAIRTRCWAEQWRGISGGLVFAADEFQQRGDLIQARPLRRRSGLYGSRYKLWEGTPPAYPREQGDRTGEVEPIRPFLRRPFTAERRRAGFSRMKYGLLRVLRRSPIRAYNVPLVSGFLGPEPGAGLTVDDKRGLAHVQS